MAQDDFISIEVAAELSTLSIAALAQRRYQGLPPRFYKPSAKTVLYKRSEVLEWIEGSAQVQTGEANPSMAQRAAVAI